MKMRCKFRINFPCFFFLQSVTVQVSNECYPLQIFGSSQISLNIKNDKSKMLMAYFLKFQFQLLETKDLHDEMQPAKNQRIIFGGISTDPLSFWTILQQIEVPEYFTNQLRILQFKHMFF